MTKDCYLAFENLEHKNLLSSAPWFIDAIKVSDILSQVSESINKPVIAVVDSGLDLNHSEFQNKLWNNPYDKRDGIDNDNNGYVDDINGWDFVQNDNSPQDGLYHGTHVAGIISQITSGRVDIMPLRFQNDSGLGYAGAAASAIYYAVDMKLKGVNVVAINCSFGGLDSMPGVLDTAIRRANDNGIIVVIAAGNNGVNMDVTPKYPGSLKLSNSITVAAIDQSLSLASYTNRGKNSVEVAAPGSDIYSALPNNNYGYVSGTSMAAPMVSSLVGLLKTMGNYTAYQIKNAVMQGSVALSSLVDGIKFGLIDASRSWGILKNEQPVTITPIVEQPKPPVIVPVRQMSYGFSVISSKTIKGWANISDGVSKPVVEIYINNRLRYRVVASQYRYESNRRDGFTISVNKKFLTYGWNLVEIRIKDPMHQLVSTVHKTQIRR